MTRKRNRFIKGMCGFMIAALLLGAGGLWLSENHLTAHASLNSDLKAIDSALTSAESAEATNAAAIADMDYIVSDDVVVKTFTKDNITIAGSSYVEDELDASVDGYTRKGVVGYQIAKATTNGDKWTYCSPFKMVGMSGGGIEYGIRNRSSDDAKIKLTVYVLFVKTK